MVDVIAKLKAWRTANKLSQRQAVEVMNARGFPVALRTLQSWELSRKTPSHRDPQKFAARALEAFLADYPTITASRPVARASLALFLNSLLANIDFDPRCRIVVNPDGIIHQRVCFPQFPTTPPFTGSSAVSV